MDVSDNGRYDLIVDIYIWTELGLNLKWYDHVIEAEDGHFKGYMAPMVDMGTHEFTYLETGKIIPE